MSSVDLFEQAKDLVIRTRPGAPEWDGAQQWYDQIVKMVEQANCEEVPSLEDKTRNGDAVKYYKQNSSSVCVSIQEEELLMANPQTEELISVGYFENGPAAFWQVRLSDFKDSESKVTDEYKSYTMLIERMQLVN